MLAARAKGKDQIVGGRETPLVSRVKKERKILHVFVAVMSKDVKAGQRTWPHSNLRALTLNQVYFNRPPETLAA